MPSSNSDDRHQADQEPRHDVLGPVGQFIALVTALVIDLTIRHLIGF
ncbi:hypothetical protein QC334_17110 [Streptomyces sp. DH18]|nr:hypothetical protein [Streptomyces sp. DH18]MDG9684416.1 hypothetical protein [Streptomyces sp. DH18]